METPTSTNGSVELPPELVHQRITDKEREVIGLLRSRFSELPPRYNDIRLCRFLRARSHNVDQAFEMLEKEIAWRKKVGADTIIEDFPKTSYYKSFSEYWPGGQHGLDKAGVPVIFERMPAIDPSSFLAIVPRVVGLQFHIYIMELVEREMEARCEYYGCPVGRIHVFDLSGLAMKHYNMQALDILKDVAAIDDNYYPESLRKFYVINGPFIFSMFWALAKLWLHKNTIAKFCIMSSKFEEQLFKDIDRDQCPRYVGGTCAQHDNDCKKGGGVMPSQPRWKFESPRYGRTKAVLNISSSADPPSAT